MKEFDKLLDDLSPILDNMPGAYQIWKEGNRAYRSGDLLKSNRCQSLIKLLHSSTIYSSCNLGDDVGFAYGGSGILIHKDSDIGNKVIIGTGVTLGERAGHHRIKHDGTVGYAPKVEDYVFIGTGAKILGGITIGKFSIIGANSVVMEDVPPFSVYAGIPARKISLVTPDNVKKFRSTYTKLRHLDERQFIRYFTSHYNKINESNSHLNVLILGSCVSRDILNQDQAGFINLVDYYARTSFASLASKKFSNHSLVNIQQIPTNFGKKMVERDLSKDIFNCLTTSEYDYLLLDLIDERFKVFYDENRTCCTISSEFVRSKFDFKTISGRTAHLGSNLRWNLWQKGFQRLLNMLRQTNSLHKLILNKVFWSTHKDNDVPFENIEQINQANLFLQQMYEVIEKEIPKNQILEFDKSLFLGSTTHRWGEAPYHYTNDYYRVALEKIKQLANFECYEVSSQKLLPSINSNFMSEFIIKFPFISNAQFSENGKLLIEKSIYKVNGFADFILDDKIDWLVNPFDNRTWQWNLQQLSFLPYLIKYYFETNDIHILITAIAFIKSWDRECLKLSDEMVWHDHGTALRARNILAIYSLSKNIVSNSVHQSFVPSDMTTDIDYLVNIVNIHTKKLLDDKFYSKGTNHGLDQSLVLFQICAELPQLDNDGLFMKIAIQRINTELSHAFRSDGGHIENSPGYLVFGLKQIISAISLGKIYFGDETPIGFDPSIFNNAVLSLVYMTHPNLHLPIIGDTVSHKVNKIFNSNLMPSSKVYNQFLYLISNCKQGVKPEKKLHVLSETGYIMYRDGWDINGLHFVMKSGFLSTYHRHDDDTSFTLFAYGEEWLTDGGLYKHSASDKYRLYLRSVNAHNLSLPIAATASRNIEEVTSEVTFAHETSNGFVAMAKTNMITGFNIEREVNYVNNEHAIYLHDKCISNGDLKNSNVTRMTNRFLSNTSTYVTRFIIPKGKKIIRTNVGVEVLGKLYKMSITSQKIFDSVAVRTGVEEKNSLCGWQSVKSGVLEKSIVVEFRYSGQDLDVIHCLKFEKLDEH